MTKYWWDIPECMPASGGAAITGVISTACLLPGKDFKALANPDDCYDTE